MICLKVQSEPRYWASSAGKRRVYATLGNLRFSDLSNPPQARTDQMLVRALAKQIEYNPAVLTCPSPLKQPVTTDDNL